MMTGGEQSAAWVDRQGCRCGGSGGGSVEVLGHRGERAKRAGFPVIMITGLVIMMIRTHGTRLWTGGSE
ncbi:hypothetical protein GCM10007172_05380 [Sinomonas atrocyanea]|nr:hypothetical protein GCM10007172_05380 [Sinomonas atrocyanea]